MLFVMMNRLLFGCIAVLCMQNIGSAEIITEEERKLRIDLLNKSWQIAVDQKINQESEVLLKGSAGKEKVLFTEEHYESSVYDRIGELIGQCVYGHGEERKFLTEDIFTLNKINASSLSPANWNYMLLANFLNCTLLKFDVAAQEPRIQCDLGQTESLKSVLHSITLKMIEAFGCDESMTEKFNKAEDDILKYAKATDLGKYIMLQNECTNKNRSNESDSLAPLISRSKDTKISMYFSVSVPFEQSYTNYPQHSDEAYKAWDQSTGFLTIYGLDKNNKVIQIQHKYAGVLEGERGNLILNVNQQLEEEIKHPCNDHWSPQVTVYNLKDLNVANVKVSDYITVLEKILLMEYDDIAKIRCIFKQLSVLYAMAKDTVLPVLDTDGNPINKDQAIVIQESIAERNISASWDKLKYKISRLARAELRKYLAKK